MSNLKRHKPTANNKKAQAIRILILSFFLLICSIPLFSVSFSEDISAMLPSGANGEISRDFALLQKSPLTGKILISISSKTLGEQKLGEVAESIAVRMNTPILSVENNAVNPQEVIKFLIQQAPNLTTHDDLKKLHGITTEQSIEQNLAEAKKLLISPAGLGMRSLLAADPLNLRSIYQHKISSLQNLPRLKIDSGQYFIAGKNALLIVAKSDIPMTDSRNGIKLLDRFKEIKQITLAENKLTEAEVCIDFLSGHRYAVANSTVIKSDIFTVSIISLCTLTLLFLLALRSKGALSIFLAPGIAIMSGLGTCAFIYPDMSAIVIGFGAVLMGISIDFAVHTYFALAEIPDDKPNALRKISKPVLFGAVTSCASFAALYISGIPGIRQLSIFSIAGMVAACAFALLFIPVFCNSFPKADKKCPAFKINSNKKGILGITFIVLAVSITGAFNNTFDTELKKLGYISAEIAAAEHHFQDKWGQVRSRSMLFASGKNMDEALRKNENAWADIQNNLSRVKAVSLAPILPSEHQKLQNNVRWTDFWNKNRACTEQQVAAQAEKLGFSAKAFAPAMSQIIAAPPQLSAEVLRSGPLAPLAKMFIPASPESDEKQIINMLPDNKLVTNYYTPQKEKELGVRLVAQSRFKSALELEMKRDIIKFISCSGLLVTMLILGLFRNLRRAALALFPAVFGVAVTFGLLGLLQIPLNIFHIVALPLVIGLGADYGIFMVFQEIRALSPWTVKAVKISGLTTLAGFGVLVFAKHPSLHSLGATVSIGITAALCCAVYVLPQLLHFKEGGHA
ncbi:MAG TPA: transporter [Desulfovibrio sp.]|nr:transporter [Desulfovibrio sp.]